MAATDSQYPAALDALQRILDGFTEVGAEDLNALQNSIQAVQEAFGVGIEGNAEDLAARLDVNLDADGALKECHVGTTTTENDNFSVPASASFTTIPQAFAMTMSDPDSDGAVIWAANVGLSGATFYGAKKGGSTSNLSSVTIAWIVWNPNAS